MIDVWPPRCCASASRWDWRRFWVSARSAAAVWPLILTLGWSHILPGRPCPLWHMQIRIRKPLFYAFRTGIHVETTEDERWSVCFRCVVVLLHPQSNKQSHIINTFRYMWSIIWIYNLVPGLHLQGVCGGRLSPVRHEYLFTASFVCQ